MKLLVTLMASLVAAACALVGPPASTGDAGATAARPRWAANRAHAAEIFDYLASLRAMGDGALAAEAARQKQAAAGDASDMAKVKAALALSLAPQGDDAEVLALVVPVLKRAPGDMDLKSVASFLQAVATDRRRLRESAAAAGGKLRDERRAHDAQKQRADALQERATQLQQKLDGLTELEKSLSDRQSPSR